MADNINRHTATSVEEFFHRLAEAIRQGKSDAQALVRLVRDAINTGKIIAVERDKDDKPLTNEKGETVAAPLNAGYRGFRESADIALAVLDVYVSLKLEYGGEQLTKDADREARNIIRTAAAILGNEWGLKKSQSVEQTSFKLDRNATAEVVATKIFEIYAKDGDLTKVRAINEALVSKIESAPAPKEAVTA